MNEMIQPLANKAGSMASLHTVHIAIVHNENALGTASCLEVWNTPPIGKG